MESDYKIINLTTTNFTKDKIMEQPLMLQSDCVNCKFYEGFGQCYYHGNNLIENCKYYKEE